jgi:transposase
MFALNSEHRYEYYTKACDMRKGFDSLCGLIKQELGRDPLSGDVFVFLNKPRNTIKLLHWERDGLVIYHKRLERGVFPPPAIATNQTRLQWPEMVMMLEGIVVKKMIKKRRFSL